MTILGEVFVGNAAEVRAFLKARKSERYTYVLHRPDGRPFYVGQGKNLRVLDHAAEARRPKGYPVSNPFKINIIRSIWKSGGDVIYRIDALHVDKPATDIREIYLISKIGRLKDGGPLTNLVAGGEGGADPSPEVLEKHRKTLGGVPDAEGDRRTVNLVLKTFEDERGSIAIKPLSEFNPVRLTPFGTGEKKVKKGELSARAAIVLGVSAAANGIVLEPGCRIPRRMLLGGVPASIENGVGRRILATGTCEIVLDENDAEYFLPSACALNDIVKHVGCARLDAVGVLGEGL